LREAKQASVALVGGLHGDNETQALAELVTGGLQGPTLLVTELSPWFAERMLTDKGTTRVRGADIEVNQLAQLIGDLAMANPGNPALGRMVDMVKGGYRRAAAPDLLALAREAGQLAGGSPGGIPLDTTMVRSLEVEADRASPETAALASARRERVMKDFFLEHYRQASAEGTALKVAAVFGRNHLGRGVDRRGVSTLGNFLSEFAVGNGGDAFHVALFAAGGTINLGRPMAIDERGDDPAFALLALNARYAATLFDLRALRVPLRTISPSARTPAQASLLYWADAYDAIVCYREVTPMQWP
jgi:hypothetical protein